MKVWEQKQGNMCRGGHKINLFDCCLIDLLHCCFTNNTVFNERIIKVTENQPIKNPKLALPLLH